MRFEAKTALITGGASGIGAAAALKFAQEGAHVIVADCNLEKGNAVISRIVDGGGLGFFLEVDLADESSIGHCCAAVARRVESLHALVNNAGILRLTPVESVATNDWDLQIAINLKAAALMIKGLLPLMKKEGGAIVNISSEGAFRARPHHLAYDITKAGLCVLTRSAAVELSRFGIRVNSVAPGWIVTEMHFSSAPDPQARKHELETMGGVGIMGRLGRPEEIANAVFFLASDEASYITGTTLHVDGGLTTL